VAASAEVEGAPAARSAERREGPQVRVRTAESGTDAVVLLEQAEDSVEGYEALAAWDEDNGRGVTAGHYS